MGKTYDGKKRWNETILATTAGAPTGGSRRTSAKKRFSGRTTKLSASMRRVDEETRAVVRNARLDALEADNFGEDADADGEANKDDDDMYVDEGEDGPTAPIAATAKDKKRGKRRVATKSKKWKVKSLAQLVFEELGSGEGAEEPNYLSVAADPPTHPARRFCCVCGFFASYSCRRCGSRFCCVACGDHHKESGCLKFGL